MWKWKGMLPNGIYLECVGCQGTIEIPEHLFTGSSSDWWLFSTSFIKVSPNMEPKWLLE